MISIKQNVLTFIIYLFIINKIKIKIMENNVLQPLKKKMEEDFAYYFKTYVIDGKYNLTFYRKKAKYKKSFAKKVLEMKRSITITLIHPDCELRPVRDSWFGPMSDIIISWNDIIFQSRNSEDTIYQKLLSLYEDFFKKMTRNSYMIDGHIKCKVKDCNQSFWLIKKGDKIILSYSIQKEKIKS